MNLKIKYFELPDGQIEKAEIAFWSGYFFERKIMKKVKIESVDIDRLKE